MVRISDILKKKMEPPADKGKEVQKPPPVAPQIKPEIKDQRQPELSEEKPKFEPEPKPKPQDELKPEPPPVIPEPAAPVIFAEPLLKQAAQAQEMQIARVMREVEPDREQSAKLYARGLNIAQEMFKCAQEKRPIDIEAIKKIIEEVVNCFVLGDKTLLVLFYDDHPMENYLPYHVLNVTVMAAAVALKLGYNKMPLNELGLAAFLHDVGMGSLQDIALKPRILSVEEHGYIKEHSDYGRLILSGIKDISAAVIQAVSETHERLSGEGYPRGLKEGQISEYARIIATVDVYESLTHNRSYRRKFQPYDAIKEMASSGNTQFEARVFKLLVDVVGVYPIGSYAQLNTDEVVKVVTPNDDFPLRPVVNVIFDADKHRLKEPRLINLAKQFNLYIKKPLSDAEVDQLVK